MARHTLTCILLMVYKGSLVGNAATTPVTNVSTPVTHVSTTLIPDTFYYNCTEEGDIHIINDGGSLTNLTIKYLNQSDVGNCTDPELQTDGSFVLTDCTKNTTVDVVLEVTNGSDIIGGHHSKSFQIKCEDVNIKPYYLNVTFAANVRNEVKTHVVNMATKPTPTPISQLTMTIKGQSGTVQEATIGEALTIVITTPGNVDIKPTECKATGNGKEETLWIEAGCKHDEELFGEKWTKNGKDVTNTIYGFRFVGPSKKISITCTVRVCPEGYGGHECDLSRCSKTKRKRINHMSSDITMTKATTSLTIKDTMLTSVTSGAGRLGFEMINTMAFFVAAFAILTVKFIKE
ncbi:uncharacterized protein LOC132564434 [Ylistrum balloti]|uniref:uncharacterized protein LOC132564434 n=1 Tax=Ylistrum balloti TaxID=509963 RepID=UPI002905F579|nr:uncharacterized protein LOC132564434 [Ylistrum balloti]